MNAVEIDRVVKTFDGVVAVDDLSLEVPRGSIYGFIGPNGSGKTTTLRMIVRILLPDRGVVRVLGEERRGASDDRVGYLPEERGLYKKMKVRDALIFHARLKGVKSPGPVVDDRLERMGLADRAQDTVQSLSKGMSQKIQFIASVIHRPNLVLLDEPFSGLDPVNLEVLRDAVLDLRRQGSTVIFSTHEMTVAESMCDTIFMIYKGKKVLDGTLDSIQKAYGEDTIGVELENGDARDEVNENLEIRSNGRYARLSNLAGVARVADFGRRQELRLNRGADPQAVLAELMTIGRVRRFEIARPSLHDIFVRIAGADSANQTGESHHV